MKFGAVVVVIVVGLAAMIFNTWQWADDAKHAHVAIKAFCQRQELALDTKVKDPDHHDLRAAMTYRFLDQGASQLCLGKEIPIDETSARTCWVERGDDACYAQLAADLLDLYRKRDR
jgi:hypothetical protein